MPDTFPIYNLFEVTGVELEYMIVSEDHLEVAPISDKLLVDSKRNIQSEIKNKSVTLSNEIVMHVIELKSTNPLRKLSGFASDLQKNITEINQKLRKHQALLLGTAMHPFMDPNSQTRLWTYEDCSIYHAFDSIFRCSGHGWSNLQSVHINLPFSSAEDFGKLHAAIRLILPIIPALAASSPVMDEVYNEVKDNRLKVYSTNSIQIPLVTGRVIPEPIFTVEDYKKLLDKIYLELNAYPEGKTLQEEWVNARGAIPRFERNSIEIRLIDIQEHPAADMAIVALIVHTVEALCRERLAETQKQKQISFDTLCNIFNRCIKTAEETLIDETDYLSLFNIKKPLRAKELWSFLKEKFANTNDHDPLWEKPMQTILNEGTLATRIASYLKRGKNDRGLLTEIYKELAKSLATGAGFSKK